MLFTTLIFAATAIASPIAQRQATPQLAPWTITDLFSYKPSGLPSTYKTRRIALRLTDPNVIQLMRASRFGYAVFPAITSDCDIEWEFPDGQPPYGEEIVCTPTGDATQYGNFSVALVEGTGELETVLDFGLKFTETREVSVLGNYFKRVFEGTVSFKAGENYEGSCGSAGVCAGQLRQDVAVPQTLIESVGSCEEYGGC